MKILYVNVTAISDSWLNATVLTSFTGIVFVYPVQSASPFPQASFLPAGLSVKLQSNSPSASDVLLFGIPLHVKSGIKQFFRLDKLSASTNYVVALYGLTSDRTFGTQSIYQVYVTTAPAPQDSFQDSFPRLEGWFW